MTEREIRKLELENGSVPFDDWFESLRDRENAGRGGRPVWHACAPETSEITRALAPEFSSCELMSGPGLRVYYGEHGKQLVILLGGGDKATQTRDINRAKQLWQQWLEFNKHAS